MLKKRSYQAKQEGPHLYETQGPNAPKWYIVDAKNQVVGRLATVLARVITGKHKTTFTRHADTGDFVVVINADQVVFTRNKWKGKLYRAHSDFVGGLKTKTAEQMLATHPDEILRQAVWGMTGKSNLARLQLKKLKLYTGAEHPHVAQNPQPLPAGVVRKTVLTKKQATA